MSEPVAATEQPASLLRLLQQELSVFPGRYNAMLRYLISSLIVIIISMSLNVPMLSFSLLVIFFATQQNIVLTRMIFPLFILCLTLAVACAILILKFTIDYPLLRLLTAAYVLMLLLYLMRASRLGFLFFGVAITITYAQSFVDLSANGEMLVRNCLWAWVAGCYATVVAHVINTLFLPVEPVQQLQRESERILKQVGRTLYALADGKPLTPPGLEEIQNSTLTLHKYLKFSVMRDADYRSHEERHLAEIATVERLYSATRSLLPLAAAAPSPEVAEHCRLLAGECRAFLQSMQGGAQPYRLTLQRREQIDALPECLREMYSALLSISLLDTATQQSAPAANTNAAPQPAVKKGISYTYVKYAVKTLLAVAICYVFYTSTQWPGIHTSMLTCIIVALPGLGASVQKSLLRISGCLVGSALALICTVFIQPHLDSIVGLLLMVAPVIALSGWVAAGSERSSYAGVQILFAFSLAMFSDFAPSPELPEIRDRVVGILLGIVVTTLVHGLLWPETEGKTLRQSLAGLFAYFGARISPLKRDNGAQAGGWTKLDATQKLLAQVALEPNWRSNDNEQQTLNYQTLLGKLRELHVALYRLETEYALAAEKMPGSPQLALIEQAMQTLAADLAAYGAGLQNEPVSPVAIGRALAHDAPLSRALQDKTLAAWEKTLLLHAQEVITLCRSIPPWRADGEVILSKV
ncbi:putative membrane protein [Serratia rubidaea]|uniref:FUSC family protein n=1 Tax=Serratia rubidaea TaxID=61652 RepID=UPI000772EA15|nr:FUSC family protein [Serratia rubidaea]AML59855.1 putative membrane protein [Serratia rubidaea]